MIKEGREEIVRLLGFCLLKYGRGVLQDARVAYVKMPWSSSTASPLIKEKLAAREQES